MIFVVNLSLFFYPESCSDSNLDFDLSRQLISAKLNSEEIYLKIQISEVTQKAEKITLINRGKNNLTHL